MRIEPAVALAGDIAVPGDKSISHRAVLLGAVADGESAFGGFGVSEDTLATVDAARALGAGVELDGDRVRVAESGSGVSASRPARSTAETPAPSCASLPGLLAGQAGSFELVGDESLAAPARPDRRSAA